MLQQTSYSVGYFTNDAQIGRLFCTRGDGDMTAQVVLMNGLGIALASDSAVTSGGKVLNTSEKVYELALPHKIAILTSGRASFMGFPWEVVFSAWYETLKSPLPTVIEYRESLYKFLRTVLPAGGDLAPAEADYLRSSYFGPSNAFSTASEILSNIVVPAYEEILSPEQYAEFMNNGWSEEFRSEMTDLFPSGILPEIAAAFAEAEASRIETFVAAPEVSLAQAQVWVEKYWKQTDSGPSEMDLKSWPVIPGLDEQIKHLWAVFVMHADYVGESNVNIVGYGSSDLFPSAAGVFFHGVVGGVLLKRFEGDIEPSNAPRHLFFAQSDAISALFLGDDSLLTKTAVENTEKTLSTIYDQLADSEDEQAKLAREYVSASLAKGDIADEMKRAGKETRAEPFRKAIGMSPILDLAEFAAQLVGVQAAYAAMTQENPSVGGHVDLAVLSHRRGFEWIRHKN